MTISWSGNLKIKDSSGKDVTIDTTPRTGMNEKLKDIGSGYGVMKYVGGSADKPHWSTDGH